MHLGQLWHLIRKAVIAWVDDYAPSMGAALAYYTLFSIALLLINMSRPPAYVRERTEKTEAKADNEPSSPPP